MDDRAGEGSGDAVDRLDSYDYKASQLVDIAGFCPDDHIVWSCHIVGGRDAVDSADVIRHPLCLAHFGLYEHVCLNHGVPLALMLPIVPCSGS